MSQASASAKTWLLSIVTATFGYAVVASSWGVASSGRLGTKLKALAEYADEQGRDLDRIIAVGVEKDGALDGLNLKDSKIRRAVYVSPAGTDSIRKLYAKHGEKYASIPADLG